MQAVREDGIALTRCGQLRPYQDSVYAGTVDARNEAEARAKLAAMRHAKVILDKQGGGEQWSSPYFTQFAADGDGRWKFTIVEEYTG